MIFVKTGLKRHINKSFFKKTNCCSRFPSSL